MSLALLFPGQGSQKPGMGRPLADAFPIARQTFEEVDEALGEHLSRIIFGQDEAALTLTRNAQPALMAVSLAVLRVLEGELNLRLGQGAAVTLVAGHSLGEYSALAAARALDLATTARLLRLRGEAMQEAVPVGQGAMAAILGLEMPDLERVCAEASTEAEPCVAANDNAPGQIVISGAARAVERAIAIAKSAGAKRALPLPVSAPFHSPLMQPAADAMARALESVTLAPPAVPLIANVTAEPVAEPAVIRSLLVAQVCGRVRWRESVAALPGLGISRVLELGAGKVLAGLVKRIQPDLTVASIEGPGDLDAIAGWL